jgi:hypothetical protein
MTRWRTLSALRSTAPHLFVFRNFLAGIDLAQNYSVTAFLIASHYGRYFRNLPVNRVVGDEQFPG